MRKLFWLGGAGAVVLAVAFVAPRVLDALWGNVPVVLHGRIVDQDGRGVAGARVRGSVTVEDRLQIPAPFAVHGHQEVVAATTDAAGNFTLEGARGTSVTILPFDLPGYEEQERDRRNFAYSGGYVDSALAADPARPFVYHVWRMGPTELLVTEILSVKDTGWEGRWFTIDLLRRRATEGEAGEGDLRVRIVSPKDPRTLRVYDWSFEIEAVGGGLVETSDPFLYRAPEAGYQPRYVYRFSAAAPAGWVDEVSKSYYVRSRGGQVYAAVGVSAKANFSDNASVGLDYAANPAGSRNLQVDRLKRIHLH